MLGNDLREMLYFGGVLGYESFQNRGGATWSRPIGRLDIQLRRCRRQGHARTPNIRSHGTIRSERISGLDCLSLFFHIIGLRGRGDVVLLPVEVSSYSDQEIWIRERKDHDVAY